jgi:four helix bundle protein
MGDTKYAKSHRDLIMYQKTRKLAQEIFEKTKSFPKEEAYLLTDQIRRSSRSIGAQIAEAWAKRAYERHFISKLTDADGVQHETQHWLATAKDCGYLSQQVSDMLIEECREIGRLIGSIINKASLFCKPPTRFTRESRAEYFIEEQ